MNTLDLDLIPAADAATLLDQKERTLAIWRCTGRYGLPFVKIGRKVFYRKSDLQAFITKQVRTHANAGGV